MATEMRWNKNEVSRESSVNDWLERFGDPASRWWTQVRNDIDGAHNPIVSNANG